jgi:phosphonate degradation associated HDIG domain protein
VNVLKTIFEAFQNRGSARYGKEEVTQLQHAVQCGHLAMQAEADDRLVTAALLHDIGHILRGEPMHDDLGANLDDQHELIGCQFLEEHFGSEVADPVRLHVLAKRYLCTEDPSYQDRLSPTSLKSFLDQGGPMSQSEMDQFKHEEHFQAAIRLRHWDDAAKDPSAVSPPLTEFTRYLVASLR